MLPYNNDIASKSLYSLFSLMYSIMLKKYKSVSLLWELKSLLDNFAKSGDNVLAFNVGNGIFILNSLLSLFALLYIVLKNKEMRN